MRVSKVLAIGLLALSPLSAMANPGCGIGAEVWEGQKGLFSHLFAASTNGTFGSGFSLTSGTSGCDTSKPIVAATIFIDQNMEQIAEDMAMGEGEVVFALTELLQVQEKETFINLMQENFDQIYTSDSMSAEEVMQNIQGVVAA
ncbi:DUF3015 family protein [Marinomonas sp. PE14-40]|uniref:DUF3015 family protein n=1 Tax=Marinomonas sp. PE14-40 TaxID=3060621 RepID=UPI003F667F8E